MLMNMNTVHPYIEFPLKNVNFINEQLSYSEMVLGMMTQNQSLPSKDPTSANSLTVATFCNKFNVLFNMVIIQDY